MTSLLLEVSIAEQKVILWRGETSLWEALCSTATGGTGSESGSYKTPLGLFHIEEKIGRDAASGTVFKSRVPTGEIWTPALKTEEDLILSRILWLAGDEPGNANTYSRYIYFHGTNHESDLGSPSSHGCIRLGNREMISLFELVEVGTPVRIKEN